MKAKNEDSVIAEWARLLASLQPDIGDEYRVEGDEEIPAMAVTFGVKVGEDGALSWGYQTGDNSFTGGAYGHPYWGVVTLTRESDVMELAREAMEECMEAVCVFADPEEVERLLAGTADGEMLRESSDHDVTYGEGGAR
jgi:hypothetical protein